MGVCDEVAQSLRTLVELSEAEASTGAMTSRQARYFLSEHRQSQDWLCHGGIL